MKNIIVLFEKVFFFEVGWQEKNIIEMNSSLLHDVLCPRYYIIIFNEN